MSSTPLPAVETALSGAQYAGAYPPGIGRSYWHVARNRIVWRLLRRRLTPTSRVLDVGCGPGIVVQYLRERGVECFGADMGRPMPDSPSVSCYLYLAQSAFELPETFRAEVDTILLMDVLEHLPEPSDFLRDCMRAYPHTKTICVTVPARMEIWSNYDEHYGHYRRYSLENMAELAEQSGLKMAKASYAFHSLYAAARAARLLNDRRSTQLSAPKVPRLHALLGAAFEIEYRLLPHSTKGSSVVAILTP